jgi:hypothetical protein
MADMGKFFSGNGSASADLHFTVEQGVMYEITSTDDQGDRFLKGLNEGNKIVLRTNKGNVSMEVTYLHHEGPRMRCSAKKV